MEQPNVKPAAVAKVAEYVSVDKSRRGYQYQSGILRPNVFGNYVAANKEEAELIASLVKAGSFKLVEPEKEGE